MAETTLERCSYCNKSLKGFFGQTPTNQSTTDFINKNLQKDNETYCSSCSQPLLTEIALKFAKSKNEIEAELKKILPNLMLLTVPAPTNWEYEVIGMVTAQTTAGTGFVTELSRSFNDLFGNTSGSTNQKIFSATSLCQANLRIQCTRSGGNAIVGTSITMSEIGAGSTNMLMVGMSGTAVRITNLSILSGTQRETIERVFELTTQLDAIKEMDKSIVNSTQTTV